LCHFIKVDGGLDVLPEPLDEHDVDVRLEQCRADLLQHRVQHLQSINHEKGALVHSHEGCVRIQIRKAPKSNIRHLGREKKKRTIVIRLKIFGKIKIKVKENRYMPDLKKIQKEP